MTGPNVWHPQVRLDRGFSVDVEMVRIIESCFERGWITRFSCQGGVMWERRVTCPAYVAFARDDHLALVDFVAQQLPPNSIEVIGGDVPAVYFEPSLIPLLERALAG